MNAVITGSTKGIGRAVAFALAREGWNVALSSRNAHELDLVREEITRAFPECQCLTDTVDFSRREDVIGYGRAIGDTWPAIDLLVNNAGIFLPGTVHGEPDGMLEKMMDVNLFGPYHLTRALLPAMMRRRAGHVINICSIASVIAYPNGGAYTVTKFALLGFSKSLREEMKPYGIKVTSILPGATWSASWAGADFPEERLMPAEDVAEAVVSATRMGPSSVVEEIIIRPQLGDL
jgi:short-subunit dehydrogenase